MGTITRACLSSEDEEINVGNSTFRELHQSWRQKTGLTVPFIPVLTDDVRLQSKQWHFLTAQTLKTCVGNTVIQVFISEMFLFLEHLFARAVTLQIIYCMPWLSGWRCLFCIKSFNTLILRAVLSYMLMAKQQHSDEIKYLFCLKDAASSAQTQRKLS